MKKLSYDDIALLVKANNNSTLDDTYIIALAWKESRFDTEAKSKVKNSSATGLMQMTRTAVVEVNRIKKTTYSHDTMTTGADNIEVGTTYLKIRLDRAGGSVSAGLDGYGTGPGYSTKIIAAQAALAANPKDKMGALYSTIGH